MKKSVSTEDYLKAILKLESEHKPVTTKALADHLGIAAASVTGMIKVLAQKKLISYRPYRGVRLNPQGRKMALQILRTHRLIELFLVDHLGMGWDEVHCEAEKWEHVISDKIADRIDEILNHPKRDPHGSPIPTKNGNLQKTQSIRMTELKNGQFAQIDEIPDDNSDLLKYLGELGLFPGTRIRIKDISSVGGIIKFSVKSKSASIGFNTAELILVQPE